MTTEAGTHVGYLIGAWMFGVLFVLALAVTAFTLYAYLRDRREDSKGTYDRMPFWVPIWSFVFVMLVAGLFVMVAFPFDRSFHTYYRVTGAVEQIGSRQIADGKGMSTRYVFLIGGQPFGVDDTRASLTKVGDYVTLTCSRQYQYDAESGWACNWGTP